MLTGRDEEIHPSLCLNRGMPNPLCGRSAGISFEPFRDSRARRPRQTQRFCHHTHDGTQTPNGKLALSPPSRDGEFRKQASNNPKPNFTIGRLTIGKSGLCGLAEPCLRCSLGRWALEKAGGRLEFPDGCCILYSDWARPSACRGGRTLRQTQRK